MLIPQLYGRPFLDTLAREFGAADRSYVATAWVRASGVGLLWDSVTGMLGRGGRLRVVAGIDRENTSREGLAMRQLRDPADGLARRLDENLLDQLARAGYVESEARLRGKAGKSGLARAAADRLFGSRQPIRRRIPARVPVPKSIEPRPDTPVGDWNRVFVKLRLARGTQGQIPLAVAREVRRRLGEVNLDGPFTVIDRHTRAERQISPTFPRRRPDTANTYKIEAMPAQGHAILKLELVGRRVLAEFFDSAEADGRAVYELLIDGLRSEPASTVDPNGAAARRAADQSLEDATEGVTLYRFD